MMEDKIHNIKVLTIITEASIESSLIDDFESLGVNGFTIIDARGKGRRGSRMGGWESNSNIRIEIICDADQAKKISTFVKDKYFENYAIVIYISDSQVFRLDKF
ncbi:MAG: DUF3240 family protein [Pseudomonadota bacterium]